MNKRLQLGCKVLFIGTSVPPTSYFYEYQRAFIGVVGVLVAGPYAGVRKYTFKSECWTVEGPGIALAKKLFGGSTPFLRGVPSNVLIRIDDPDVKLDTSTNIMKPEHV